MADDDSLIGIIGSGEIYLVCGSALADDDQSVRTIWNDPAGFSPELRENYYLRHILNDWNV